jgi:hypothetical protein
MAPVQGDARRVGQQADERTLRGVGANLIEQGGEDDVAQPATLMLGEDRHVEQVEVPAPVPEDTPHSDALHGLIVDHVNGEPAAMEAGDGLISPPWAQSRTFPKGEIVVNRGWPLFEPVSVGKAKVAVHARTLALAAPGGALPTVVSDGA